MARPGAPRARPSPVFWHSRPRRPSASSLDPPSGASPRRDDTQVEVAPPVAVCVWLPRVLILRWYWRGRWQRWQLRGARRHAGSRREGRGGCGVRHAILERVGSRGRRRNLVGAAPASSVPVDGCSASETFGFSESVPPAAIVTGSTATVNGQTTHSTTYGTRPRSRVPPGQLSPAAHHMA